ncbi:unnamed protein product [Penicillium nalgiovense]|uniref:Uncharacterized protein n=1 Tax=Penicillium nalgiovense TaxID=60175 RepID=A0A9W4HGM9_PENNA|nr:unnamed protein product [Penicillium nalgiovense]CAG7968191.1 unnamed protein product [Penicillium nalgiovense]CAG7972251.1 unnamed protein product [Penicillium nalgiovense]CAG7980573.1 unnamed protein product [Penicillium nalgiovense]CAG7996699.1 unnamed protein product [Penicillium nalgiovense]
MNLCRPHREVLSHYDCTLCRHRYSVTRLWLSEVARCTQRGLFEAIAGECDELDTTSCQHAMNGDALMNTIVSDPVGKIRPRT